jgi:hypothetical protein
MYENLEAQAITAGELNRDEEATDPVD